MGLPCAHILSMCNEVGMSMIKIQWLRAYHYYYLSNTDITTEIDMYQKKRRFRTINTRNHKTNSRYTTVLD
jgi:hypothetical protein